MGNKNIIIYGGKGNGTVVLAALQDINRSSSKYNIIGFVNNSKKQKSIDGYPRLGDIDKLPMLLKKYNAYFINAVTSINTIERVKQLFEYDYEFIKEKLATVIHPSAFVGYNTDIKKGSFIGPQAYIGQNTQVGEMSFIHSQCYVARDTTLNKYCYLAPKVYIGAEVEVMEGAYIGIGSIVRERIEVGEEAIIGMGSVIVEDVPRKSKFYGEKAKRRD